MLQALCFNRGVMGHDQKNCKKTKVMSTLNPTIPKYGHGFGIPIAKSVSNIIKELQRKKGTQGQTSTGNQYESLEPGSAEIPKNPFLGNDFHMLMLKIYLCGKYKQALMTQWK